MAVFWRNKDAWPGVPTHLNLTANQKEFRNFAQLFINSIDQLPQTKRSP